MNEIICPKCDKAFKVDEAGFAAIQKQVRDQEFSKELNERMETAEREKNTAIQLKESDLKNDFQEQLALKNDEINALKLKSRTELVDEVSKKRSA